MVKIKIFRPNLEHNDMHAFSEIRREQVFGNKDLGTIDSTEMQVCSTCVMKSGT